MKTLALVAVLFLPGCYSLGQYRTAEKVAAASSVEHDEYEGTTWVNAPLVWYTPWTANHKAYLRTLFSESGQRTNQLYVIYNAGVWAFLERAADRHDNTFKTIVISREVSYPGIREHVAVELPDNYLEAAAKTGIDIQLKGTAGSTIVKLPPHYVAGFVEKVSSVLCANVQENLVSR